MNDLDGLLLAAVRARAEEAQMTTDTTHEHEILESRLNELDRQRRTRRIVWGSLAAAAAVVVLAVGARTFQATSAMPPAAETKALFTSTEFGVPFTVESLPSWLTTQSLVPTSEANEWVTWNRCPQNVDNECIGLSFNRYSSVLIGESHTAITFASYVSYLDQLGASGKVHISGRRETTVDGRRAVVYDITAPSEVLNGVGCHHEGAARCDDFFGDVPGRYAVIDTTAIDADGAVLDVWTRAGGVGPAEVGWQDQFDQMLTTLRFTKAGSSAPTG